MAQRDNTLHEHRTNIGAALSHRTVVESTALYDTHFLQRYTAWTVSAKGSAVHKRAQKLRSCPVIALKQVCKRPSGKVGRLPVTLSCLSCLHAASADVTRTSSRVARTVFMVAFGLTAPSRTCRGKCVSTS